MSRSALERQFGERLSVFVTKLNLVYIWGENFNNSADFVALELAPR